jgi:HAD superfamily hydrolase (TIGR01549 family)
MKTLVLFDLDGTLVDAYPAIIESVSLTLEKFGYPAVSALAIRRAVGWGDRNLLKAFIKKQNLDRALAFYRKVHAKALLRGARWLPGALEILRCLKARHLRLAIASNRPTRFTYIILKALNGRKYFDAVLCADRLSRGKPHPMILNKLAHRLGVAKKNILFVGDMAIDVQTARRAGVDVVAVATGSNTISELKAAGPKAVIKKIDRLSRFLK